VFCPQCRSQEIINRDITPIYECSDCGYMFNEDNFTCYEENVKNISENLLEDLLNTIVDNLKINKKLKISKFGTFSIRNKKKRIGRIPLTKEKIVISDRNVVLFKPSKEFKDLVNSTKDE